MYKINGWIKDKDDYVVRYIRDGFDSIREAFDYLLLELKDIEILECHISKEI